MAQTFGISYPFDSGAATFYEGWPFTDFFVLDGQPYGLGPDGIYRIGGDDDAGEAIEWAVEGPDTDTGTDAGKRVRQAVLCGRLGEDVRFSVGFDGKPLVEALDIGGGRFAVGSDQAGRTVRFRLDGTGPFALSGVDLRVLSLGSRRI